MANAGAVTHPISGKRWTNLIFCIICMIMIANLQYGWTLFVDPISKSHGWTRAAIQVAFAIFIALETWLTPIEGWIADTIGPKPVIAFGGIMVGIGWVINSYADSLTLLYIGAIVGGIGGGAVYATSVGQAVKWFPDRRGLAVGLTAAGYGAGAVLTVIPIRYVIAHYGYEAAFLWFGIVQGAVVFVLAWFIRAPQPGELAGAPPAKVSMTSRSHSPKEVLISPVFWLLY
ncbi:MAG: MFS transporter, partial [Terriglobia bacterium]